jgi:hypothetical protein
LSSSQLPLPHSPVRDSQSAGQRHWSSPLSSSQLPLPHSPQSSRQDDSSPSQHRPSPQGGAPQSSAQLHASPAPAQQRPSPQVAPAQSPGQVHWSSPCAHTPSPHRRHTLGARPLHTHSSSITHWDEQPSPLRMLPSSHSSAVGWTSASPQVRGSARRSSTGVIFLRAIEIARPAEPSGAPPRSMPSTWRKTSRPAIESGSRMTRSSPAADGVREPSGRSSWAKATAEPTQPEKRSL